jgi:hypothetical protein
MFWDPLGLLLILLKLHEKAGEQILPFSFLLQGVCATHGSNHGSRKKRKIFSKLLLKQQHMVVGFKMKKCELKYVI